MKSVWIPMLVGLVGVGLGWILASAFQDGTGPSPAPAPVERAAAPTGARTASPPKLVGLPPPTSVAVSPRTPVVTTPGPTEADREAISFLGLEGLEGLSDAEEWIPEEPGDHRGWHALLTLYALAGRLADFQRIVPKALDAGMERGVLLELLRLLPPDRHVVALDHLLATYPGDGWDVATIADVYIAAGAGERAVDVLVPALEASASAELAGRLVQADPDRAARILGAMTGGEAWTAGLLGQVGVAFLDAQRPELALTFLQDALAQEPVSHEILLSLNRVDPSLALEHARMLTQEHAERGDVWTWLGQLESESGDSEAAFVAYHEAAKLELTTDVLYGMMRADPDRAYEAAAALTNDSTDDEVLGAVAKVALKSGRAEDSMATLLRAHQRDPSDHEWMVAMVALDPESAAEVLGRTVAAYSGESRDEVLGAHGNALLELGHGDEAWDRYMEAYELDPGDWEWQRGLARSDPERAIPMLEARREEAGDEGDLIGALADAYAGTGRHELALEHYDLAIRQGGGDEWYVRMGLVDSARALAALGERVRTSPEAGEAWAALGDLHRRLGNREEARAAYEQARAKNATSMLYEIRYREMGD